MKGGKAELSAAYHITSPLLKAYHASLQANLSQETIIFMVFWSKLDHSPCLRPVSLMLIASFGRNALALSYSSVTAGYLDKSRPPCCCS
jgi:hypothetical protein